MEASTSFSMPADVFVGAARVTSAYAILFVAVLFWQGMTKLGMAVAALRKKEHFDRCDCLPWMTEGQYNLAACITGQALPQATQAPAVTGLAPGDSGACSGAAFWC